MLKFIIRVTILLGIAAWLMGCDREPLPPSEASTHLYVIHIETIRGHDYIITNSAGGGAVSTVHAEHCPCKGGN